MSIARLEGESGWKNAGWTKKIIRKGAGVSSGAHLHVPVIEADPDTYDTPDGYRAVTIGRNVLWVANKDIGNRWRGEQTINLSEPYSDRKVRAAISTLQTMRGQRYMIFGELDESVDLTSKPESVEMYIAIEGKAPSSIFGVPDSPSEEWRIFSDIPADTTLLVEESSPRILTFDPPK